MTATNPRHRNPLSRPALALGLAALLLFCGCKSTKDGGSASANGGKRDPLVSGPRIPPQNVPLPERGGAAVKGTRTDPLLEKPVGRGVGYSDDPERFKGTYIPGAATTPAALASKLETSNDLKIDSPPDNRVPLRPAGGDVKPAGGIDPPPESLEPLYAQLQKLDVTAKDRSLRQENGQYVFRASVPLKTGAKRHYEGVAATATDAVKQVLDQIAADPR
jgi:hypothetical protein